MSRTLLILSFLAAPVAADDAPWATYRGNARRTGNTDNLPGPAKPEVLWFLKSTMNFVASPVPSGADLLYPALGAGFNDGNLHSLPAVPKDPKQIAPTWSKTGQVLRLPTVSSPAVSDGKVVFGCGRHDSPGAALLCLPADGGYRLWVMELNGPLMHMEASPTVANGRVYTGGGSAGVLCLDLNTVTLDGKEMNVKDVP